MHIHASYAQRLIKACHWCGGAIESGTPIMRGIWYYRRRSYHRYWHWIEGPLGGNCYQNQVQQWFDENSFVSSYKGGRKPLEMTANQRKRRRSLIVMASGLRKKKEFNIELGLPTIYLDNQIRTMIDRFLPETGQDPPSRWMRELQL